jgi:hypothetical protein
MPEAIPAALKGKICELKAKQIFDPLGVTHEAIFEQPAPGVIFESPGSNVSVPRSR